MLKKAHNNKASLSATDFAFMIIFGKNKIFRFTVVCFVYAVITVNAVFSHNIPKIKNASAVADAEKRS